MPSLDGAECAPNPCLVLSCVMQNPAQALRLWQHFVADLALEGLPCDASVAVQVVIGTVLEGYQTLSKIASQQTFKPNQKIQQVGMV